MTITADSPATTNTPCPVAVARMGFTIDRAALIDALTTVGLAVAKRPLAPILSGVLLQARDGHLTISATDHETMVTVRLPGIVKTTGTLLVDHGEIIKLLGALVKGTPKRDADAFPVTLRTLDDGTPLVDLAGYAMPVTAYPPEDYPTVPNTVPTLADVDRETFTRDIARVMVAVGKDYAVPMLTGVHLEITPDVIMMAATDRYRLTVAAVPAVPAARASGKASALVPGHTVAAVVKRFTGDRVRIGFDDVDNPRFASFVCGDVRVSVCTLDAQFLAYGKLVPQTATGTVQTERAGLLAATRRAAAVLGAKRQGGGQVLVTVARESVSVAPALDDHTAAVTAPAQPATVHGLTGTQHLWFNPAYLVDALNTFTGEMVTLHTQANVHRPVLLTDEPAGLTDAGAFRHLVMPMREPVKSAQ